MNQDVSKSEIRSHRILTEDELAKKGQRRVMTIARDIQCQVEDALGKIEDERTRLYVTYLVNEGTLHRHMKKWSASVLSGR